MKKLLILIVIIGVVVWVLMRYGTPEATAPATSDSLGVDTTESITADLDTLDTGETDAELNALDADVNSL